MRRSLSNQVAIAVMVAALGLLLARLILYVAFNYPSPGGDSGLFLTVSAYDCYRGVLGTLFYPPDYSSGFREFTWHGFLQPYAFSKLNPGCSLTGYFVELSVVVAGTFALVVRYFWARIGLAWAAVVGLIIAAVQIKQGFRPETLAITIIVAMSMARSAGKGWLFATLWGVLAWCQPTLFILHSLFVFLTTNVNEARSLFNPRAVVIALGAQALLLYLYPFAITDLVAGLAKQGAFLAARDDGDIYTYYVRSDHFPLFGFVLMAVFSAATVRRKSLLVLIPAIAWFGFKAPPTYYNLTGLLASFLLLWLDALWPLDTQAQPKAVASKLDKAILGAVGMMATFGLTQGIAKDVYSIWKFDASPASSLAVVESLGKRRVCGAPLFLGVLRPDLDFESFDAASCRPTQDSSSVNLVAASGSPSVARECVSSHPAKGATVLDRVFRSDSGYSFYICP